MIFSPQLHLPAWWPGTLVLCAGILAIGFSLYRRRSTFKGMSARSLRVFLLLLLLSVFVVVIPRFSTTPEYNFLNVGLSGSVNVTPLAYAPIILAAGWWGSGCAILLALTGSLAHALWDGLYLFTLLEWALVAGIVTFLIRQDYIGKLPMITRNPVPAALVAAFLVWPLQFAYLILDTGPKGLAQLDLLAAVWAGTAPPLFSNLLFAGMVGEIARRIAPDRWSNRTPRRIPPYATNLNRRLLFALLPTTIFGIALLVWASTRIVSSAATELVIDQMTRDAENAADIVPFFIRTGERLVLDLSSNPSLYGQDIAARTKHLSQGIGTIPYFNQLVFFDTFGRPLVGYPETDVNILGLTAGEIMAVQNCLQERELDHELVFPNQKGAPVLVSFVSPVVEPTTGELFGVLLGRANVVTSPLMIPAIKSLQGLLVGSGIGFMTDGRDRIIYHPDPDLVKEVWQPDVNAETLTTSLSNGRAYRDRDEAGLSRLIYYLPVEDYSWKIVIVVPFSAVLVQTTKILGPFTLLLLAVGAIAIVFLLAISRRLTLPLGLLATATEKITAGHLADPVDIDGPDEVGRLGEAFERMRTRVRSQVDELSILLDASRSVAGSLKLEECLPPILDGALSVTDAVGARLLLKSFNGRNANMQSYSAGPASIEMGVFDDSIFNLVENDSQIIAIENVSRARAVLDTRSDKHPLQAIIALPVQHETSLIGVLWLGYTNPHIFSRSESDLLMTLAGQAAIAVANSRLFEASEGGRQQLDAILTATPDAIIVTDPKLRLVLVNPAAEDIFDLKDKEITGRRINEIIHQPQLAVALHSSDERTSSHEIKLPDGRTFSGSTSSILRQDGSITGRLAVLRDITEFKELDQQKTDAIESVSNDLKGPLALMQGYSTMLPMVGKLNNRQTEFAEKIAAGVEQMSNLIEDVLDLHRIESALGSNIQELDLGDIVQNQIEEIKPIAVSRGIQLVCSVGTGIEMILGDKSMFRRAIRHLLDNSLRYTSSGGMVQVNVQMRESELEISVADSGVGISRADQDRLFEKFYRVHGQQDTDSVGSGLGLSFVKSIVELHDGRVWLESQLGQGSTFYFALPVQND